MLKLRLFGPPEILIDDQPLKLARRKSRALVYYLAAHKRPLHRESLLATFWPDNPRPAAQQILRTTLHGLRKTLGKELLVDGQEVALAPSAQIDVRLFEEQLSNSPSDPAQLAKTLELYRGEFLEGFYLPDTPDYNDWVLIERERLQRLAVRGLNTLSSLHEASGDYLTALDCLERALAFDPLQEDLQRESIRLLYLSGDRPAAIRRYDQLRKLLDEEMGVPPMVETRVLYDAIINDKLDLPEKSASGKSVRPTPAPARERRGSAAASQQSSLPFIGRAIELQSLLDLATTHGLDRLPRLTLIEGEAGIGKTRLAEEFAHAQEALLLKGNSTELEHTLPYQPVIEALRNLLARSEWHDLFAELDLAPIWMDEIIRLLPELSAGSAKPPVEAAGPADARLWEGIHQFLLALGRQQQVIFFLDDLHWADASTLALLAYLVRQASTNVFYLGSARPAAPRSALSSLLGTLTRAGRLVRIPLNRLTQADITELAGQFSPKFAYPLCEWLLRNSEGNPQILAELIRYAAKNRILLPGGELNLSALTSEPVLPSTIYNLLQWRLAQLSNPARRVLDAAVAAGREFEFELVYQAAGLSESAALDALDELLSASLVVPVRQESQQPGAPLVYAFDHSLTMEVAYREIGEARHRRLHRQVAKAMEKHYRGRYEDVAGKIAAHYIEGGDPQQAAVYAMQAGRRAAGLAAWTEAAGFYEQALSANPNLAERKEILMALGETYYRGGQPTKAAQSYRTVMSIAEPDSPEVDQARLALAQTLLTQSLYVDVLHLTQQVIDGGRLEFLLQAEFLAGTALSLEGADLEGAAAHLQRAESKCQEECNPLTLAEIKFEQGSLAAQQGYLDKAVALYQESLQAAQSAYSSSAGIRALPRLVLAYNNLAYHLHLLSDPQALNYVETGLSLAREKGELPLQTYLLSTRGEIALAAGDLDLAQECFLQGLALAERIAMLERIAGLTANLGLVEIQRGQHELAIHHLSTALAQADALGTQHLAAQIRLWLAPLLPPTEARHHLDEARAIATSGGRKRLLDEITRLEAELGNQD
jgi:DNA-binding SARP family transcriptional activator/tetratricopeptide (TPR) repeat protein